MNGAQVTNYIVRNPSTSPNTDGIDVVGSQNVTLANLDIDTGDDNLAIKSGLPGIPADAYYQPPYNLAAAGHEQPPGRELDVPARPRAVGRQRDL